MTINNKYGLIPNIILRDLRLPDDYDQLANLFNLIEPGTATAQSLEKEDQQIPANSNLSHNESGLLIGFGRTRMIAETVEGQIIGYGAAWRAPWSDPGELASSFCVHPNFRNQGVGERILTTLEKWANNQHTSVLLSELKDWIEESLPFVQKRGFTLDAHIYELRLDLNQFDSKHFRQPNVSGIQILTLADLPGEESEQKLYQLYVETSKDNPGQSGCLPDFPQWQKKAIQDENWIFIALDDNRFVGVTTLFTTEESGVIYTDYTGVISTYRGRGIAQALKLTSIAAAIKAGAHKMTTDTDNTNAPMQAINRKLGYVPGDGHYRIRKLF